MDILDSLALWARKYEQQTVPTTGKPRFSLADVLEMFDRNAILELTPIVDGKPQPTVRPDRVSKVKVSLLDNGISALPAAGGDWYEVYRTAPTGDLSKVRILAHRPDGTPKGEIRMLVGRRTYDHYFAEDPIFAAIEKARSN